MLKSLILFSVVVALAQATVFPRSCAERVEEIQSVVKTSFSTAAVSWDDEVIE